MDWWPYKKSDFPQIEYEELHNNAQVFVDPICFLTSFPPEAPTPPPATHAVTIKMETTQGELSQLFVFAACIWTQAHWFLI